PVREKFDGPLVRTASNAIDPAVDAPHLLGGGLPADQTVLWRLSIDLLSIEFFCTGDYKITPRSDMPAHQQFKYFFGLFQLLNIDTAKCPVGGIHRSLRQLIRVHFSKTLIALDRLFYLAAVSFYPGKNIMQVLFLLDFDRFSCF